MNNQEHNSIKSTQEKQLLEIIFDGFLLCLKIIFRIIFKLIHFLVLKISNGLIQLKNYLKPHLEKLETLLYARARDFFGL